MTSIAKSKFSFGISALSISAIVFGSIFVAPVANADTKNKNNLPPVLQVGSETKAEKTDRFIVSFTDTAKGNPSERGNAYGKIAKERGISVKELRETATGGTVIQADRKLSAVEAKSLIEGFKSQPNVAYAEADFLLQPTAIPNDPSYNSQWDLFEATAGLQLPGVWDKTTGAGQVVAVIDTGILPHSDLNANMLPGYDMIWDAAMARDGGGRDSNPRDEGDWRASGDCGSTATANSSWHGTHVAGTIGAVTNNGNGISGVAYGAKVLPIRALGLCGGYMSDVADSIIWASGGTVSGVPANPTPARSINLSLGGPGVCATTTQIAIDTAVSRGSAVFAAAGNDNQPAANSNPASCNNAIVVGASGRNGNRSYYSNYGSTVDVMAPGGDSAGYILSTLNSGTTVPGGESYANYQGTSMATPHAAAVGALMFAADPSLTPAQVETKLKATARPLPVPCAEGCGTGLIYPLASVVTAPVVTSGIIAGTPTITGTAKIDSVLTANPGTWGPGTIALSYQWNRSGVPIAGATAQTYKATASDTTKILTVTVTGSATGYTSVSKTSIGTAAVEMGSLTGTRPIISGNTYVGSTLTANAGTWGPAPVGFAYQWYRSGVAIVGATSASYTLTSADLGSTLKVRVTGLKEGYAQGYLESATTVAITSAPAVSSTLTTAVPTITGTAKVGTTLTANAGTWGPAPVTLSYQWYRSGALITGATAATYVPTTADQSYALSVKVTGTKSGYTTATTTSANTAAVAAATTVSTTITSATPTITGKLAYGSTLTANAGTWGPSPVTLTYQWYRSGQPISGATASTYKLTLLDRFDTIRVRVTGAKLGYTTVYRDSLTTAKVK